jgi:transcriptional regulator with XRE-family HTH domain
MQSKNLPRFDYQAFSAALYDHYASREHSSRAEYERIKKYVGLSRTYIKNLMNMRIINPSFNTVVALCGYMKRDLAEFITVPEKELREREVV